MAIRRSPTSETVRPLTRGLLHAMATFALLSSIGCAESDTEEISEPEPEGVVAADASPVAELENKLSEDPTTFPQPNGPKIGAVAMRAPIYSEPSQGSKIIGYLRAGTTTTRAEAPAAHDDCDAGYYRIEPTGFVCAEQSATLDMDHPILRAMTRRADKSKPMPYPYAFVRAIAPRYYRVPTKEEQLQYEMSLKRHLRSYNRLAEKWDALKLGANDLELDEDGNAIGVMPDEPPEMDYNAFYGGNGSDAIPWFFDGGRQIPNISSFKVPDYAVITNRIKRKAMVALVNTFVGPYDRRFAMTTDARLIPTSKLKPDRGSYFHGVSLEGGWTLPIAFVKSEKSYDYDIKGRALNKKDRLEYHQPIQLTGNSTKIGDNRLVETAYGTWVRDRDVAIVVEPSELPRHAKKEAKWVDISIFNQTLVMYEKEKPIYATMVSTGRDGLGEPGKTLSTPTGSFRIYEKHTTVTMDSSEVGNEFELVDVPWVQYFKGGYALHAAPWHDDYGRPRSHGCVNMSPIDARRVFTWSDPPLPDDWHGVDAHELTAPEGTLIHIHP